MRHVSYKSTGHGFRRCMIIGFLRDWARFKWARRNNWREEKIIDFFILFDSQENHFPPNYVNLRENLEHYVCPGYISYRARNSNLRWFFGLLFFFNQKETENAILSRHTSVLHHFNLYHLSVRSFLCSTLAAPYQQQKKAHTNERMEDKRRIYR